MTTNEKIDAFIEKRQQWKKELIELRSILQQTELKEEVKWGAPAYTLNGKILIGLGAFKNHMGLWFHQGVFLKDLKQKLVTAQEKTKALRQWRFEKGDSIDSKLVGLYVQETIENCLAGKEIRPERTKITDVKIPEKMNEAFALNSNFKEAFDKLSPGKRKEYALYISEAKREATQDSRLEKIEPMILNGAGLHDKYKNC